LKSIDSLSEDHNEVLKILETFYQTIEKIEDGKDKDIDRKSIKRTLHFFNSKFWLHFDKEEQTIFPELSIYIGGGGKPSGPVVVMLDEHQMLRESNKKMQLAYKNFKTNSNIFTSEARNFTGLLRQHIRMEEEMLFPMAVNSLDHSLDSEWLKMFELIERNADIS